MFEEVIKDHCLLLLTRRCKCGEFVLQSDTRGYDSYVEHLNEKLVASMPQPVLDYWTYMKGK